MLIYHKDMPQSGTGTKLDDFDRKILAYLLKEDWPVTTETVGKELRICWNTAQLHLYKLKSEGLVKGKRVGRQNQRMLTDKGRTTSK
ncbi:MAG TPA: hypothetical protein VGS11_11065 [Candidatus Bathyarchaeia archaeon]|nr:hypothetical protein [Candidatus Bathyarchaeia archaeon]